MFWLVVLPLRSWPGYFKLSAKVFWMGLRTQGIDYLIWRWNFREQAFTCPWELIYLIVILCELKKSRFRLWVKIVLIGPLLAGILVTALGSYVLVADGYEWLVSVVVPWVARIGVVR